MEYFDLADAAGLADVDVEFWYTWRALFASHSERESR